MGIKQYLNGETSTVSRRDVLKRTAAAGVAATAGCMGGGEPETEQTPTDNQTTSNPQNTTERTTEDEETSTETEEPSQEEQLLEDVKERRAELTDSDLQEFYEKEAIPQENNYSVDADLESIDTRRGQIVKVIEEVGEDYPGQKAAGTRAMMHALHNELDWMGWEDDNIVNIVTRYNSAPMQNLNANYKTEDGGRNLDAMFAHGEASGEDTFYKNVPDSEIMNGAETNFLATDIEELESNLERNNWDPENYKATRLDLQSVIPGVKGPSLNDESTKDRGIVFDSDAIQYIGESYDESAEATYEVTEEAMEIHMSSMPIIESGRSVGVTAGEDGLEVDAVYSQEEAEEKLREPIEL